MEGQTWHEFSCLHYLIVFLFLQCFKGYWGGGDCICRVAKKMKKMYAAGAIVIKQRMVHKTKQFDYNYIIFILEMVTNHFVLGCPK